MGELPVFHVRNAQPGDMLAALTALHACPGLTSVTEIVEYAESIGFAMRDRSRLEALITARDLGLVHRDTNVLLPDGEMLLEVEARNPNLFADLVHGLQYGLWLPSHPWIHCFSWTYQAVCQALWQHTRLKIDRRSLASEIEGKARSHFDRADIALSPKSTGGVVMWLRELTPAVIIDGDHYESRHFCPPELLLLAIDHIYQSEGVDYGAHLLLNEARQDAICQMCLLDSQGFERVLQYAVTQFSILEKGIGGGWGQYLRLERQVTLEDLG